MRTIAPMAVFLLLVINGSVLAQNNEDIDEIITSTRVPLSAEKVGSSISIITEEDLEIKQIRFLSDELRNTPGISVDQYGPRGTVSSVRLRGQGGEGVLVLIDGMETSDTSTLQTTFDFSQLTANGIRRVEVLRGSQSVLYGGDAVGGVVNITTHTGAGDMRGELYAEAGSYQTRTIGGGVRGGLANDALGYSVDVQYLDSEGFSAADDDLPGNSESEEYDNLSINGKFQYRVTEALTVGVALRSASGTTHSDAFGGPFGDDPAIGDDYDQTAGRLYAEFGRSSDFITGELGVSRISNEREGFGSAFSADYDGERDKVDFQTNFNFNADNIVVIGAELEEESLVSTDLPQGEEVGIDGYFAMYQFSATDDLHLSVGTRVDDHEEFGSFDTYRGTVAYELSDTTKLRSSVSTGFRAPSLFELYGVCCGETLGNTDLEPEESKSWDIGIEQWLANDKVFLELAYFSIKTDNEIAFCCFGNGADGNYHNFGGTTKSTGVEVVSEIILSAAMHLGLSYTYNHTEDDNGSRLPQRPVNTLSVDYNYAFSDALGLNINALHYEGMLATGGTELDEPWVVTLAANWHLSDNLLANFRIENLLDDQYQTQPGYGTSDRAVYGGVKLKF